MSQTLIITDAVYPTTFSHYETHDSQSIECKETSLLEYYDNLPKLLEEFNQSPNFQEKIKNIKSQLENENFAEVKFEKSLVDYYLTIVPPKFKK